MPVEEGAWPVFVDEWQLECCGAPFSVGDTVEWTISFVDPYPALPDDCFVTLDVGPNGLAVAGGMVAARRAFGGSPGEGRMRGLLVEEHHGGVPDDLVTTTGIVRRIQVVTEAFTRGKGQWIRAGVPATLRDVSDSPRIFDPGDLEAPRDHLSETGVLVDLAVRPGEADPPGRIGSPQAR